MNDLFRGLNLIVYNTYKVFDDYRISTKHILTCYKFCVIDLDSKTIKETFKTKKEAYEYVSFLTNQTIMLRRLDEEMQ